MWRTGLFAGIAISNDPKTSYIRGRFGRGDMPLSDDRKITPRHCREIAEKVRQLARQTPIAEIQEELFDLQIAWKGWARRRHPTKAHPVTFPDRP
jgi:hypothetical protein